MVNCETHDYTNWLLTVSQGLLIFAVFPQVPAASFRDTCLKHCLLTLNNTLLVSFFLGGGNTSFGHLRRIQIFLKISAVEAF